MNPSDSKAAERSFPDGDDRERCTLYLLGELSDDAAADFERQLSQSSKLGQLLESQSRLIDEVARVGLTLQPHVTRPLDRGNRFPWMAASVALAACAAWALFSLRGGFHDLPPSIVDAPALVDAAAIEELLIAKVWADDAGNQLIEPNESSFVEEDPPLEADGVFDVDSALSWMVVAMAADGTVVTDGDLNDG